MGILKSKPQIDLNSVKTIDQRSDPVRSNQLAPKPLYNVQTSVSTDSFQTCETEPTHHQSNFYDRFEYVTIPRINKQTNDDHYDRLRRTALFIRQLKDVKTVEERQVSIRTLFVGSGINLSIFFLQKFTERKVHEPV